MEDILKMEYKNLVKNYDGSYTFDKNGLPYNCPNFGEWAEEYAQVHAYALEHPDEVTEQTPPPQPSLDDLKASKFLDLSAAFDAHVKGAFTTSQGYFMQFSPDDSLKVQGSILLMEESGERVGYLVQADNVLIPNVPLETIKKVFVEMLNAYALCYAKKQEYRAVISACKTVEELNAVVFQWPV